jgi:hypothetical protein
MQRHRSVSSARLTALVLVPLLTAASSTARADSARTDVVVDALEKRNADRDAAFDQQATASQSKTSQQASDAATAARTRRVEDAASASDYASDVEHENHKARRKTGVLLGTIGLSIAGIGAASFYSASLSRASIEDGGFENASQIELRAELVAKKQGIAYGAWGVSGLLGLIGLGLAW